MRPFLLILLLVSTRPAYAISCQEPTIAQSYHKATIVFYGRYLGTRDTVDHRFSSRFQIDQFTIEAIYKGIIPGDEHILNNYIRSITIALRSNCRPSSGDYCFKPGTYYLVYATPGMGMLEAHPCLRTRAIYNDDFNTWKGQDERAALIALAAQREEDSKHPMTGYTFLFSGFRSTLYPERNPYNFEVQYLEKLNTRYKETLHTYRYIILVLASILAGRILAAIRRWRRRIAII